MLPTSANSFSRSMYISTSCPSSKIATLRSWEVPGNAPSRSIPEHAGHTARLAALRSKPEGMAAWQPSYCSDLLPSRFRHCRDIPEVTADDAILNLKVLLTWRLRLSADPLGQCSLPKPRFARGPRRSLS